MSIHSYIKGIFKGRLFFLLLVQGFKYIREVELKVGAAYEKFEPLKNGGPCFS